MKTNYESFSNALEARSVAESWQPVEKGGRKGGGKEDEAQKKSQGESVHPCCR